jgi:hypothetical protein
LHQRREPEPLKKYNQDNQRESQQNQTTAYYVQYYVLDIIYLMGHMGQKLGKKYN